VIGEPAYLKRWWVIPRNEQQNVYLHLILRDDEDRALHDHPWENTSYVISGSYREITPEGTFLRQPGDLIHRPATALHRLELIDGAPAVSLFFTGPKVREWGFECPQGWRHWRDFTGGANGELVGRGCD
jgi:quercetin dioxygenase-like cupin family protein